MGRILKLKNSEMARRVVGQKLLIAGFRGSKIVKCSVRFVKWCLFRDLTPNQSSTIIPA